MSRPHFFVWSGGVINLERVVCALVTPPEGLPEEIEAECEVVFDGARVRDVVTLSDDDVGRFLLHCAQFHEGRDEEAFINREAREEREGKGEG